MSYTEYEEHQIKVINNVIENTKNSKEDSLSMMIDGKESNILYETTEQALEGLKIGDFYKKIQKDTSHPRLLEYFNNKIKKEIKKIKKRRRAAAKKARRKAEEKERLAAEKAAAEARVKAEAEQSKKLKDLMQKGEIIPDDKALPYFDESGQLTERLQKLAATFGQVGGRKTRRRRKKKGKRNTKRIRKTKKRKFRKKRRTRQKR